MTAATWRPKIRRGRYGDVVTGPAAVVVPAILMCGLDVRPEKVLGRWRYRVPPGAGDDVEAALASQSGRLLW